MPRKFDKIEWQLIRHSELTREELYDMTPIPGLENTQILNDMDDPEHYPDSQLNAPAPNIEIVPLSTFNALVKGYEDDPSALGANVIAKCTRKIKPGIEQGRWEHIDFRPTQVRHDVYNGATDERSVYFTTKDIGRVPESHEYYAEGVPAQITLYLDQAGGFHQNANIPPQQDDPPGYHSEWADLVYYDNEEFHVRDNTFTREEQYAMANKLHEFFAQFRTDDFKFGARWMPSDYEVQRGQFGNCLEWALAHQQAYPELAIGMHWFGDGNHMEPDHFFTHDGKYAYDTNGVHELPYEPHISVKEVFPDADDNDEMDTGTEYNLSPEEAMAYQAPREGRMPSREWIMRYAPNPNQPPDVSTPNDYIEDVPEIWDERRPWNNEEPNGWSPMSQHVNEDRNA